MSSCLKLSWKKGAPRPPTVLSREHIQQKKDFAKLLVALHLTNLVIIYIDECSINDHTTHDYAWSKKGSSAQIIKQNKKKGIKVI